MSSGRDREEEGRSRFEGFGVSPGIAIGEALVLESQVGQVLQIRLNRDEVEHEVKRFDLALRTARLQLRQVKEKVTKEIGSTYAGVFDAQTLMLKDRAFSGEIRKLIREHRLNADWALQKTAQKFRHAFTPQGKPALDALRTYYNSDRRVRNRPDAAGHPSPSTRSPRPLR